MDNDLTSQTHASNCPACGNEIPSDAILCIECGFHIRLGRRLGTVVEKTESPPTATDYSNPYATPNIPDSTPLDKPALDLSDRGAHLAAIIVNSSDWVYMTIGLSCFCCVPVWGVMFPWFAFRLTGWYRLHHEFAELRHPNSLSPHSLIAVRFQDAKNRLILGTIIGFVFWLMFVTGIIREIRP